MQKEIPAQFLFQLWVKILIRERWLGKKVESCANEEITCLYDTDNRAILSIRKVRIFSQ
jgi:hypothetical protein